MAQTVGGGTASRWFDGLHREAGTPTLADVGSGPRDRGASAVKIYVILIALLPLVAIGLDIYRDESKLAFIRDVAAPLSGEDAAAEADDREPPAAAKIAPHGDAGGEDPPAAPPIDSGALTDIAPDAGGTAEFETPGVEIPLAKTPLAETPLAETLGIETEGPTAREAAQPPEEPATGETSTAATATPIEPARDAARATAPPSAAEFASSESASSEPASAGAAGRIDPNLVWLVQDRLNRLGYAGGDPLIPDGRLNLDTKLAVRAYQIHRGMPSDGLPSAALLEHLESALEDSLVNNAPSLVEIDTTAPAAGGGTAESAPQATESVVQASEPRATQEAALPAGDAAAAGMVFQEAEPEAPNASLVFLIQDRLNRLGYSGDRRLSVDGRMGPRTRATIVAYQEDRGLPPTGAPTEALLGHMEAALIGKTPRAASPAPATAAAAAPEPPSETAESQSERPLAATGPAIESGSSGTEDEAAPPSKAGGYESFRRGLEATRQGSTETAIAHYSRAIDSEDWLEKHLAFSRRGDAHHALGNLDAALADYSAAIRLKPDDTGAMLRRALIYETKAMLERAISDYRRVTELDPDEPRATERLQRLGIAVE